MVYHHPKARAERCTAVQDITPISATVAVPSGENVWGTHAYIIRMRAAARLHALSETFPAGHGPLDMWMVRRGLKVYIINPPLVHQFWILGCQKSY